MKNLPRKFDDTVSRLNSIWFFLWPSDNILTLTQLFETDSTLERRCSEGRMRKEYFKDACNNDSQKKDGKSWIWVPEIHKNISSTTFKWIIALDLSIKKRQMLLFISLEIKLYGLKF